MKDTKAMPLFTLTLLWFVMSFTWAASDNVDTGPTALELKAEIQSLKKEISELENEIEKMKQMTADEAKRFQTMLANNKKDLENRIQEQEGLQNKIDKITQDISKEKQKQTAIKNQIDNNSLREKKISDQLIEECRLLASMVEKTLPWDREERLERINTLRRDLESGTASFEEGFSRLQGLYDDEIKAGDQVVLINKPITRNNGEIVNAQVLKIGNQWIVYMDDEGKNYGVLQRTQKKDSLVYTWKEDLEFNDRKSVREAIEVKLAKKPPKLVQLPLTLSLQSPQLLTNGKGE